MGKAYCFYQNYREVRLLVIHCSATRYDRDFPVEALRSSHKADTRTYAQRCTLMDLLRQLRRDYPEARILGHYQLSPYIRKACPCFDAREEYGEI